MGKYKTLAKNTGFVFIGTIGSKLINIIMLPLYTRWLNPEAFGAVDTMTTYSMFIVGFVCLCLPDAIFIYPRNASEEKRKEYFSSGLIFSFITMAASGALFWLVQTVMLHYDMHNVLSDYTWLIYWLMVSAYLQTYLQSFIRSIDKMLHYSITGIVLTLAVAVFSILLIPPFGLDGYAYALIAAHFVAALYSLIFPGAYKYLQVKGNSYASVKEMLSYSAPLLPNGIMWYLVNGVNRPIMEHFLGLFAIGIYAVANKFTGVLYSVLSIFGTAWSNSALDEFGKPGFDKFYNNYLKMLSVVLFAGGYLLTMLSRPLVTILAAPEYFEAYKYVPVLTLGVIFSGLSGTVGGIFSAIKQSKYFFYSSVWGGVSSVVALIVLTSLMGLMGTCISVSLSFFVMLIARIYYSVRYAKIEDYGFYIFLIFIYLVFTAIELLVDSSWRFAVYAALLVVVALVNREYVMKAYIMVKDKFGKNK